MTALALLAIAGWFALALVTAWGMGRRGHSPFTWAVIMGSLGPLGLPLAAIAIGRERAAAPSVLRRGGGASGTAHVVVGIDGSAASEATLAMVCRMLGPQLGRLTLATVVDFDQGELAGHSDADAARAMAARLGEAFAAYDPTVVVLTGRPAIELAKFAAARHATLLAVGGRGLGNTSALLRSVAEQLTRTSTVPVLLGGAADRSADTSAPAA